MTCSLPGRGRTLILTLTCALLADGPAQISHWIAPGDLSEGRWTDPNDATSPQWTTAANWDNGVPNQPDAVAVLSPQSSGNVIAHIANTTVELGELRLEGPVPTSPNGFNGIKLGSATSRGTLIIGGSGYHVVTPPGTYKPFLVLLNGDILFRNAAVASGSIVMDKGQSSIQFSDTSVFSGYVGTTYGGGIVTFRDHSSINGGEFSMSSNGYSRINFRDDAIVHQGSIRSSWGVYHVVVHDRADLSGLAFWTSRLGTGGGYVRLDISAAAGPVRLGSIYGDVSINLGANTLVFGTLPAGTFRMNSYITGTGGLRFEGTNVGTVRITSLYTDMNSHTGSTYVGSRVILGSDPQEIPHFTGRLNAVQIAGGGQLIVNHGTVTRSLLLEEGSLVLQNYSAPALTVDGSYTQHAAGVLSVPVSSLGRLVVTGAAALGGRLDVISLPAVELGTQRFPILTAGSISGSFASLTGAAPQTAMLQSRLEYAADRVDLLVEQQLFAQVPGATPAATALGRQIDRTLDTAVDGYRDWIVRLNRLTTPAEVGAALAGVAPDRLSALPEQAFARAAVRGGIFRDQLRADEGAFVAGLHGRHRWDSSRGLPKVQSTHDGGLAGVVLPAGPVRFGAFGARERSTIDLDDSGSTANDTGTTAGLGFHFTRREYFLTWGFAATGHRYRWHRIVAQAPAVTATHATRARQQDWEIGVGRVFPLARWQAVAEAGVLGSAWRARHSRENGAGILAYEFDRWKNRSLRSHLGFTLARTPTGARGRPYAGVHWWHDFEPDRALRGRMPATGGDYYTAPGRRAEIDEVQLRLGMNWQLTRSWTVGAEAGVSGGHTLRRAENYFGSVRRQF